MTETKNELPTTEAPYTPIVRAWDTVKERDDKYYDYQKQAKEVILSEEERQSGWFFHPAYPGEGYFQGLDTIRETVMEGITPTHVFCMTERSFVQLSVEKLKEEIEDHEFTPEDFDANDCVGWKELERALVKFNVANAGLTSFMVDLERVVKLP